MKELNLDMSKDVGITYEQLNVSYISDQSIHDAQLLLLAVIELKANYAIMMLYF